MAAQAQSPEFRAMWATRFEWPHTNKNICKNTIDSIMEDLADANFNAVFFQIRGQADVLYPSPYEVWSPLIGGSDPGWDPLAYAIEAAHTRGLEFHAYINTHTCWQSDPAGAQSLPDNPDHIFYTHCDASDPAARDWLHHSNGTDPQQFNESDYVWFAPGVPDYQAYIRQQVLYVVENYDVDGVHFDRIRTPGTRSPSYDPISLVRYNSPHSNPDDLDFNLWTADQITRTVQDIYAAIMAVKPWVKVSVAAYPNFSTAKLNQHQDVIAWAQTGAMDMLVPMMYSSGGAGSSWDYQLQAWLTETADVNVHIVAGHITSQGVSSLLEQVSLTRARGGMGNSVFSWGSFWYWDNYVANVYQTSVAMPAMPWKDSPTTGILHGYVTAPDGAPVVDAQVTISGSPHTALSSGDGFYSFLQVTPGTYTVTAYHREYAPVVVPDVVVGLPEVARHDVAFTAPAPPGDFDEDGDIDLSDLSVFLFCMPGPNVTFIPGHFCETGDSDLDADVDLADLAIFQQGFTG